MRRFNISAKIWLSVGVFIFGYVLSMTLGQIQSRVARASLRVTSQALFPAALRSQEAESAFQRMVKGFGDAVVMQDASGLDRASEDGKLAVRSLQSIAVIQGLAKGRADAAASMASALEQLLGDAQSVYAPVLTNHATASTPDQMHALAERTDRARTDLARQKEQIAADLRLQLSTLEADSAAQSRFALIVFALTMSAAGLIVHLTIQRSITGPILRVIGGVRHAAEGAAHASTQMAQSGKEVAMNAQEQAACIQETSASLVQISTTTKQNAGRAGDADQLMQGAHQAVERAATAMEELTASMTLISNSSHQVAAVLKRIDEIAFHTNILALNAAIEAARAGEAGAGFSVVADEVRSLAHRAAEAARSSGATIEQTLDDVSKGVDLVNNARSAFQDVKSRIASGTEIVSEIACSSNEQARGIINIEQAVNRISSLTQRNGTNARETADGADKMSSEVESTRRYLAELVEVVGLRNS